MRILINDFVQESDAPDFLKSPALADNGQALSLTIDFGESKTFDCIGVGNTGASTITIDGEVVNLSSEDKNGLYQLQQEHTAQVVVLSVPAPFTVGRVAIGKSRSLGLSPSREPGLYSTNVPRETLSGQVIAGVGGITGRRIDVDVRYKIDRDIFNDFELAYPLQLGRGFPFFLLFEEKELHRMPWERLYAKTDNQVLFQSSANFFLHSKKFSFRESF